MLHYFIDISIIICAHFQCACAYTLYSESNETVIKIIHERIISKVVSIEEKNDDDNNNNHKQMEEKERRNGRTL